jgi:cysteine synthase
LLAYHAVVGFARITSAKSVVHALAFDVMKVLPAFHMLDVARRQRLLQPGQAVVDTSSGTFAVGLARVCKIMGCEIAPNRDPT